MNGVSQRTPLRVGTKAAWWVGRGFGRIMQAVGRNGNGHKTPINAFEGIRSIPKWNVRYINLEMDLLRRTNQVNAQEARLADMQARLMRCLKGLEAERAELETLKAGLDEEADVLAEDLAGWEERLDQREEALFELNGLLEDQQGELDQKEVKLARTLKEASRRKKEVDELLAKYERLQSREEREVQPSLKRGLKIRFENLSVDDLSGTIELI